MLCHLQKFTNLTIHDMLTGMIRLQSQHVLQLAENSTMSLVLFLHEAACACLLETLGISKQSATRSCAHRWQMQRLLRALAQSVGSAGRCVRDEQAQCLLRGPHDWSCPASHPLQALQLCHWQECSHDPSHTKPEIIMRERLACHVHCALLCKP